MRVNTRSHEHGHHLRMLLAGLCAMFVLALGLAACGDDGDDGSTEVGNASTDTTDVTVSYVPFSGSAPLFIAQEQGYFEEEGLEVEAVPIAQPSAIIANLVSGKQQFGYAGAGQILAALQQGIKLRVVVPAYYSKGENTSFYVDKDGPIKSAADLEGKTIGLGAIRNHVHAAVLASLEEAGVDPDSVKFSVAAPPNLGDLVTSGKLDAAQMIEPFRSLQKDQLREVIPDVMRMLNDDPKPVVGYVVASAEYADANPDTVAAFTKAYLKANVYAEDHPAAVRAAVGEFTELTPELLETTTLPGFGTDLQMEEFEPTAEVMAKYGFLDGVPDGLDELAPAPGAYPDQKKQ